MDDNRTEGAARNLGGKIQEAVGDLTGDAATQVRGKVNQAAGRAQNAIGGAADEARDLGGQLADVIRDQPLAAAGLAVGVGVMIGFLLRR